MELNVCKKKMSEINSISHSQAPFEEPGIFSVLISKEGKYMSTKHGPSQRGPHCVLNDLGYDEQKKLWALLFQRKLQSFLNNALFLLLTDSLPLVPVMVQFILAPSFQY